MIGAPSQGAPFCLFGQHAFALAAQEQNQSYYQHDRLIDAEGVPDDASAQQRRQRKDDHGVHREAAQQVDEYGLFGPFGGIEIGGDHGVQCHDHESPCVLGQCMDSEIQRSGIGAKESADTSASQTEQRGNHGASDEGDEDAGDKEIAQIFCPFCTVTLAEERLQALRRAVEHRH